MHWFSDNTLRVNTCLRDRPRWFQWGWQYLKCHLDDLLCVGRVTQDSQANYILSEVNTAIMVLWKDGRNQLAGPLVEWLLITAHKAKLRHATQLSLIMHWADLEKSSHWDRTASERPTHSQLRRKKNIFLLSNQYKHFITEAHLEWLYGTHCGFLSSALTGASLGSRMGDFILGGTEAFIPPSMVGLPWWPTPVGHH